MMNNIWIKIKCAAKKVAIKKSVAKIKELKKLKKSLQYVPFDSVKIDCFYQSSYLF